MAAEDKNHNFNRNKQVQMAMGNNRYSDSRNTYWFWKSMPHHVHLAEYESQFVGAWRPFVDEIFTKPLKMRTGPQDNSVRENSIRTEPRPVTATCTENDNDRSREILSTVATEQDFVEGTFEPFLGLPDVNTITSPVASCAKTKSETDLTEQSRNPKTDERNKRLKRKSIWRRMSEYIRDCSAFYVSRHCVCF